MRRFTSSDRRAAKRGSGRLVTEPTEGCVVLLGSPRAGLHHAGVYTDGKLLHALRESVFLEPLESVADRYKLIEFWGRP